MKDSERVEVDVVADGTADIPVSLAQVLTVRRALRASEGADAMAVMDVLAARKT
jgi:hypothetical protein